MKLKFFILSFLFFSTAYSQEKFFGGNGDGFATASITNVVLPVQVFNFYGRANGSANILYWSTAAENNSRVFEIERSVDAMQFNKIAEVAGAGNSSGLRQYQFTDDKLTKQQYYYRLKQIDIDERYTYSSIIQLINKNEKQGVLIFPNPVSGRATVLFQNEIVLNEEFLLINSSGQLIDKMIFKGRTGMVDLTGKATGYYLLVNHKLGIVVKIQKVAE